MTGSRHRARAHQARADLHQAAGIAGRHDRRSGRRDVRELRREDGARRSRAATRLYTPALPQHWSLSVSGTSSSPGIAASTASGGDATRCAWSRWQGASYATCTAASRRARGPAAASSSLTSRTFALNVAGAAAPRRIAREQVAVLLHRCAAARRNSTATNRAPLRSNAAMLARASSRAVPASPACACSAPQQRWPAGAHERVAVHGERALGRAVRRREQPLHHAAVERRDRAPRRRRRAARTCATVPRGSARGREHGHGEAGAPRQAREQRGDARRAEHPRLQHGEREQRGAREDEQDDARDERKRALRGRALARRSRGSARTARPRGTRSRRRGSRGSGRGAAARRRRRSRAYRRRSPS